MSGTTSGSVVSSAASTAGGLVANVRNIVEQPFSSSLDVVHLFLLTGLVLVFIMAWLMILYHIRAAAETI